MANTWKRTFVVRRFFCRRSIAKAKTLPRIPRIAIGNDTITSQMNLTTARCGCTMGWSLAMRDDWLFG